jgi:hypothetical protein
VTLPPGVAGTITGVADSLRQLADAIVGPEPLTPYAINTRLLGAADTLMYLVDVVKALEPASEPPK